MSDQQADIPKEPEAGAFGPLRALAECQLQIQFTLGSMYDTQAIGILGLDAALSAAAIAGAQPLGQHWWMTLIGLLISSCFSVWSLRTRADETGLDIGLLIPEAEHATSEGMNRAIALLMGNAIADNDGRLEKKSEFVWWAMAALATTVFGAAIAVIAI